MKRFLLLAVLLLTFASPAHCGNIPNDADLQTETVDVKFEGWKYKYNDDNVFFKKLKECDKSYYHEEKISDNESIYRYIFGFNDYDECNVLCIKSRDNDNEMKYFKHYGCFIPRRMLKDVNKRNFYKLKGYCF